MAVPTFVSPLPDAAPQAAAEHHEFTAQENLTIGGLATRMQAVGMALVVLSCLLFAWAIVGGNGNRIFEAEASIVLVFIGIWSHRAGREFRRVASTSGANVPHLMNALSEIRKLYELQFWIFVAAALLIAVSMLVAIGDGGLLPVAR